MSQPEYKDDRYNRQVETIKMRLDDVKDLIARDRFIIDRVLMIFVMDSDYHRAAIAEAEKQWKRENGYSCL